MSEEFNAFYLLIRIGYSVVSFVLSCQLDKQINLLLKDWCVVFDFMKGKQSFRRNSSVCYEWKACRKRVYMSTLITVSEVSCEPGDLFVYLSWGSIDLNDSRSFVG